MGKKNDFGDFLAEKHAEQYVGTKDCMVDDCADWVSDLSPDEFIQYGDLFAKKQREDFKKKALSQLQGLIDWLNCW